MFLFFYMLSYKLKTGHFLNYICDKYTFKLFVTNLNQLFSIAIYSVPSLEIKPICV